MSGCAHDVLFVLTCRNPVRAAYISSLESQISSLRDELATVYKTQGQNAQRLLAMNETLREKEEMSRMDSEALRRARDEAANLRRKVDQHAELMAEKDRTAQVRLVISHSRNTVSDYSHGLFLLIRTCLCVALQRFSTTRSARSSSNSVKSKNATRTSHGTTLNSSNAGSTPNKPK